MANRGVSIDRTVTSAAGAQVNGLPVYIGGNLFNVQHEGPAPLGRIEISNDKLNWVMEATALADATMTVVTSRPMWARPAALTDAGGPRAFSFRFYVFKEVG